MMERSNHTEKSGYRVLEDDYMRTDFHTLNTIYILSATSLCHPHITVD